MFKNLKNASQLRRSFVGKYYFVAMLLFNAYCFTMNSNQTGIFKLHPTKRKLKLNYRPELLNFYINRALAEVDDWSTKFQKSTKLVSLL